MPCHLVPPKPKYAHQDPILKLVSLHLLHATIFSHMPLVHAHEGTVFKTLSSPLVSDKSYPLSAVTTPPSPHWLLLAKFLKHSYITNTSVKHHLFVWTKSVTLKMGAVCFSKTSEWTKDTIWCTTHDNNRNSNKHFTFQKQFLLCPDVNIDTLPRSDCRPCYVIYII
jgi:hypothetical protein